MPRPSSTTSTEPSLNIVTSIFFAVTDERFVDAVVDHLVCEVIRSCRIRVHARPAPHRLKAAKDLDIGRIVTLAHLLKAQVKSRGAGILAGLLV